MSEITCYCGGKATKQSNANIYGREYGNGMAYICEDCKGYVGCHNDGRPLGTIVDKETKQLRMKVHAIIDPLWKSKKYKRKTVYKRIAEALGVNSFHTGECDAETCNVVIETIPLIFNT